MSKTNPTMAQQVAQAAHYFQRQLTGHAPTAVTAILDGDTVVITLRGAFTPAEQTLATSLAGAAQIQEYHRQLFASAEDSLRQEIRRITGMEVREATAELDATTGSMVHTFTNGTLVQMFQLSHEVAPGSWSGG